MATAQLPESRPAKSRGGLFDYISASRLNTWLACPLKFKLRYIDGIEELPSPSLFLGQRVHAGLEYFYRGLKEGTVLAAPDVSQHVRETWDEAVSATGITFDAPDEQRALRCQAVGLIDAYLAQRDPDEGTPLLVEAPLRASLLDDGSGLDLGVPLFGFIDLVLDGPTGPMVVDFKTSSRSSTPLDIAHEIQLTIYSYLLRNAFGQCEQELQIRSLIKTKQPKVETCTYSARIDSHFRRLFSVIGAYLDDLRVDRFVYRPGWTCSMCDFRESECRSWEP